MVGTLGRKQGDSTGMKNPIRFAGLLGAVAIVAAACGGGNPTTAPTTAGGESAAPTEAAGSTGPAPLSGSTMLSRRSRGSRSRASAASPAWARGFRASWTWPRAW